MKDNENGTEKSVLDIRKKKSIERLNFILEDLGLENINQFSEKMGYARPEKLYKVMRGENAISKNLAKEINDKFPKYSEDWLLTGEGEMLKGEESPIPKNIVEERDVLSYSKGIPYYNVDFINGFTGVEEITHQNAEYNIDYPPANHCQFWVNATGESMKGIIDNGDKIALKQVDTEWFPLGEVYAIVTTNGHRMVKKIVKSENNECYKLISANPDKTEYPDQDIPKKMIHTLFKVVTTIKFVN